jgi:hypothetical protein
MRISVRTLVELVAVAAFAVGFWDLHRSSRPPGPALKALRGGDEPARIAALRDLSIFVGKGEAEGDGRVVPGLILAARHDPTPAVRRGALYALSRAAIVAPPGNLPIEAAFSGTLSPPTSKPYRPSRAKLPLLRPRAAEVAAVLVDRLGTDPDPTVRAFALRGLRVLLTTACDERARARAKLKPGQAAPPHESSGNWVESAALAVAEATGDPDPEVLGQLVGFLAASQPAKTLLPDARRAEALAELVADDAPPLPTALDVLVLNNVAVLLGPNHEDSPRLVRVLLDRIAHPRVSGDAHIPHGRLEEDARTAYTLILWELVPSVDFFAEHPEADVLVPLLSGGGSDYLRPSGATNRLQVLTNRFTADILEGFTGSTYFGGLPSLPDPRRSALKAIGRDPRLLGHLWPRVDRTGRLEWLANELGLSGGGPGSWSSLEPLVDDPRIRADLPPDEAEAQLSRLLDEPGPGPDEDDEGDIRYLIRDVESRRRGQPEADFAATPLEAARLLRNARNLAILAYFARSAEPGSDAVSRLVDRLRSLLDSADPPARARAATLLGSLGPAAREALPALESRADADPDELARQAAEDAVRQLADPDDRAGRSDR